MDCFIFHSSVTIVKNIFMLLIAGNLLLIPEHDIKMLLYISVSVLPISILLQFIWAWYDVEREQSSGIIFSIDVIRAMFMILPVICNWDQYSKKLIISIVYITVIIDTSIAILCLLIYKIYNVTMVYLNLNNSNDSIEPEYRIVVGPDHTSDEDLEKHLWPGV